MRRIAVDNQTYELAEKAAARKRMTVEEVVCQAIRDMAQGPGGPFAIIGLFADEPELVDYIIETAMEARAHPLRVLNG